MKATDVTQRPLDDSKAASASENPSIGTAALSPEELNDNSSLMEEDPEIFGQSVAALHRELGRKIFGGCCGTDDRHIRALAAQLAIQARQTNSVNAEDL